MLDPSAGDALAQAHAAGWTVVVKEALANGRLATPAVVPPALRDAARAWHAAPDAVALAAALAQPWADVVLSGASTPEHLRGNLRALTLGVDPAALGALGAALAQTPQTYWQERSALPWT